MTALTRTRTVLLCAATKWEAEPLARALKLSRRSEALFSNGALRLAKIGAGASAAAGLSALEPADLVVSVGLCGALQPGMRTGDVVFDVQGAPGEWPPLARECAAGLGLPIHFGHIIGSAAVVSTKDAKAALGRQLRAAAVDMESEAIRSWARGRGCEAFALRAVLDGLEDSVPADLPKGEGAGSLLRYALGHWTQLPLLLATGGRQRRAMGALGAFLSAFLPRIS